MTKFVRQGHIFEVAPKSSLDVHDTLPVGTYAVKFNDRTGTYYLETIEDFALNGKIYGDTLKNADKIFNTFQSREASTGVLLNGEKGSGKTLLAKKLSIIAAGENYPTIVVNQPWFGETFNTFIQSIEQPAVILFDEFEKVYDRDQQERMLTLLDGVYPSKKLFILTCNDKYRVNSHMLNRPGRIFYRLEYKGLDAQFIREYATDNLKVEGQKHVDSLAKLSALFTEFNFDMLKAIVEEMNRYDETPQEAMTILNARPEHNEDTIYSVTLEFEGKPLDPAKEMLHSARWSGNPLQPEDDEIEIMVRFPLEVVRANGNGQSYDYVRFQPDGLQFIDEQSGALVFTNALGYTATLVRQRASSPEFYRFAY